MKSVEKCAVSQGPYGAILIIQKLIISLFHENNREQRKTKISTLTKEKEWL